MALARQIFNGNSSFVAPAGVYRVRVAVTPSSAGRVSNFANSTIVQLVDGTTWAWGQNNNGQLGLGTTTAVSSPVQVVGSLNFQLQEANNTLSGNNTTIFIDKYGGAWSCGYNGSGQLGNSTNATPASSPVQVVGGLKFCQLASNNSVTQYWVNALDTVGNLWSWGSNSSGQFGTVSTTFTSSPVKAVGSLTFSQVACGSNGGATVFAIDTSQNLWAMGANNFGQLGNSSASAAVSSPVQVAGGIKWAQIFPYSATSPVGLDTSGNLWTWGSNANTNFSSSVSSPVKVVGGLIAQKVSVPAIPGQNYPCVMFIDPSQNLWGYGDNVYGQLGVNTTTNVSSPVQVVGGLKWLQVSMNSISSYGIDSNFNLWAWGNNGNGQLGNSSVISASSPVQVVGGLKWAAVFPDGYSNNVLGVTLDGVMYGWGINTAGALGIGTSTPTSSPVQVVGGIRLFNLMAPQQTFLFDVTPGTSYPIVVNPGLGSSFAGTPLINFASQVVVEYEQ